MSPVIPIVLLHYGQPEVLLNTVQHITRHTRHPYLLFVVDNATPESPVLSAVFSEIEQAHRGIIVRNKKNNWISGFNLAIDHPRWPDSELYAFSDADILVPDLGADCWLQKMVDEMTLHRCIGKLGLSLDLANLKANPALQASYDSELRYMQGEKIGSNIIAPVDTTMALYRHDFFISKFKFRIGHQSLQRPYYYICRTAPSLSSIHVGWDFYPGAGAASYSVAQHWIKAWTMCKMGTFVAPEVMRQFNPLRRVALRSVQYFVKAIHFSKVLGLNLWYAISHMPRDINEIQSRSRQ
jgi:hypothetical protein